MLLNELLGAVLPIEAISANVTKKVQPVKRIAKTGQEPDVKKKPVLKGRIDTYA